MKNIAELELNLPAQAPLMVLPGAQLFPNALLPLYIFEPRYREMLSWSLERDRMFCIAPTKPGVAEAQSTDDFHHTVGLGLVRACVAREDGTSHLVLQGIARVRLTSFLQDTPFRIAEVSQAADQPAGADEAADLTAELLHTCEWLQEKGIALPKAFNDQLPQIEDLGMLTDIIAHSLLRSPEERQAVLEELAVAQRGRMIVGLLRGYGAEDND